LEFEVENADCVDHIFADRKRPEGVMMLLRLAPRFPAATEVAGFVETAFRFR